MKRKITKILVPLDGSKNSFRGLDEAIFIARRCHAAITGLFVVPLAKPKVDDALSPLEKIFLKNAASFMKKAKTRAAKNGILFYDRVTYGDADKIVKFAKQKKFDIIIIGSRGRSKAKEILLGSTANHVLHKSSIPVMIVK